jgi:glycosyltransferase involved in cell wall biosynthesis
MSAKVAIIGSVGIPPRYGGFETVAQQLVNSLENDFSIYVYCSQRYYKKSERIKFYNKTRLFYLPFNALGFQSIFYDALSLKHAMLFADILLVLGISGGIIFPFIRIFTNRKIIVNVDGLEWNREKWKTFSKKILKLSEYFAVKFSHVVITDNPAIQEYIHDRYGTEPHLIEYGADHTSQIKFADIKRIPPNLIDVFPQLQKKKYACTVCRIEPENNVHVILDAFSKMPSQNLVIIGNWDRNVYGRNLKKTYGNYKNLYLLNPVYDQELLDSIRSNCYIYIHGNGSGGTNPSLIEAMYLGLPVIAYKVSFNLSTTENQAFYFENARHIIKIITYIESSELERYRKKMQEIANRRFRWSIIAEKYTRLFSELVNKNNI